MRQVRRRSSERGVVLLLTIASLAVIIPMVGLTVDVGYLYASKARLQAAVDGAALAAARALSLGATTAAQADSAKQNAVNWFYANFPVGTWSTRSTVMDTNSVTVTTPSPSLSTVAVTASTRVPTYFMKWLNIDDNIIRSVGTASRRTTVVMLVLDRSYSMTSNSSCATLKDAAKLFTGQFAAGRDYIGMVSFSDGISPVIAPTTNFRTVLGFNDGSTSGTGAIDNINCMGGTGTAAALTVGHNELHKTNLPGAYNVLVLETDGLPNSLAFDFWDLGRTNPPAFSARNNPDRSALDPTAGASLCQDTNNRIRYTPGTPAKGKQAAVPAVEGWNSDTAKRNWSTLSPNYGGYIGQFAAGMIGTLFSNDPAFAQAFGPLATPWHTSHYQGLGTGGGTTAKYATTATPGCKFNTSDNAATNVDLTDFNRLPRFDLFGNDTRPPYAYDTNVQMHDINLALSTNDTAMRYIRFNHSTVADRWTNYRRAVANATDSAAYRARASATIPSTIFVIGLGGNATGANIPDFQLMQRWANDPQCDQFAQPINASTGCGPTYPAYNMPTAFNGQPKGTLVWSSNANDLRSAFLRISSQILRLAR